MGSQEVAVGESGWMFVIFSLIGLHSPLFCSGGGLLVFGRIVFTKRDAFGEPFQHTHIYTSSFNGGGKASGIFVECPLSKVYEGRSIDRHV